MRRGAEYNLLISLPLLPLRKLGRVPGGRTVARPAVVAWHLPLRLRRRSQFGRPKAANDIAGAAPVLARPRSLDRFSLIKYLSLLPSRFDANRLATERRVRQGRSGLMAKRERDVV